MAKRLFQILLIQLVCIVAAGSTFASSPDTTATPQHQNTDSPKKKFNAGEFIFDHIGDSHEWHIATIGHTHVSVPLPIILYSRLRGKVYVFMSSNFHHGHSAYKGFWLNTEGKLKGKISEANDDGTLVESAPLPLDFSMKKNVVAVLTSLFIMLWLFISIAKTYKRNPNVAPTGIQNLIEIIVIFVRDDIVIPSIGEKHYSSYMPFLLTMFFFIWINNLLGLIPIFPAGANVTGNIAVTMALAIFSFGIITISANKHYWKHIVNTPGVPWFLKVPIPIMPVVEITGIFIKPFVLMVRLFANILAGHMIAIVLFSLIFIFGSINVYFGYGISVISVLLVIFMTMLELLVAAIQAYVFTMLTALFIGMATAEHH
jgi:F-type H+-transporting ATPase subunit a